MNITSNDQNLSTTVFYVSSVQYGVGWFLSCLLVFCISYTIFHERGKNIRAPALPSFTVVLLSTCLIALVDMYISLTTNIQPDGKSFGRWLWDCAQAGPQANILTNIVAFYVGCVAGVNNWGDKILELSNSFRIKLYGYVSFGFILAILYWCLFVAGVLPITVDDASNPGLAYVFLYISFVLTSVMTIYALWVFFRFHFAETGTFSRFAAEAAYGVYLTHYPVAEAYKSAYWEMIKSLVGEEYKEENANVLLGCSLIFVLFCTVFTLWPLMYFVRKLPGFKQVL